MLSRRTFLKHAGHAAASVLAAPALAHTAKPARHRPNLLLILADDCTRRDLPLYGGGNAITPHLDHLASEGLVFDHAYVTSAMCQPCRAELYTGLFPMRNGCAYDLVKRYMHRPAEELYDTAQDPYEMTNLADDEKLAPVKTRLRAELDRWMSAQGDPGLPQDTRQALQAARQGKDLYGPPPTP
jgi:arylsulfatase A-like enzyme